MPKTLLTKCQQHCLAYTPTDLCRFLANGWPITTTTNQGLGVQVKQLIMSTAASMGTTSSSKLASGLLDTWAAIQHVPINPSGTSTGSGDSGTGFGDSTATPATPEEANPFASSTATQSQEFQAAAGVVPSASNASTNSPSPVSAADALIGTAIQQGAAVAINTTVNTTKPVFGNTQAVVFTPYGDAVAPTTAPFNSSLGTAHIEAPKSAPHAQGAPHASPAPSATPKVTPTATPAVQTNATKSTGSPAYRLRKAAL